MAVVPPAEIHPVVFMSVCILRVYDLAKNTHNKQTA